MQFNLVATSAICQNYNSIYVFISANSVFNYQRLNAHDSMHKVSISSHYAFQMPNLMSINLMHANFNFHQIFHCTGSSL